MNEIIDAAISNNQVYQIIKDPDVHDFLMGAIAGHEEEIDSDNFKELMELFQKAEIEEGIPDEILDEMSL